MSRCWRDAGWSALILYSIHCCWPEKIKNKKKNRYLGENNEIFLCDNILYNWIIGISGCFPAAFAAKRNEKEIKLKSYSKLQKYAFWIALFSLWCVFRKVLVSSAMGSFGGSLVTTMVGDSYQGLEVFIWQGSEHNSCSHYLYVYNFSKDCLLFWFWFHVLFLSSFLDLFLTILLMDCL